MDSNETMTGLANLIRDQATAMNNAVLSGYNEGLREGFRRGRDAAAELVKQDAWERNKSDDALHIESLAEKIRALKPKLSEAA